jgi:hypothetical protein
MTMSADNREWRRSSYCGTNACVEVARVGDRYLVRDSKNPDAAPLDFSSEEWSAFVAGVKGGDFASFG